MPARNFYLVISLLCLQQTQVNGADKYSIPPPEFFHSNRDGRQVMVSAGDILTVRFYYNPELNKTVRVREDGKISLDLFQGISVASQSLEEIQKKLVELYSQEFVNPAITVDIDSRANSSVFVTGEVLVPGPKELRGKMTVAVVLALSQVSQKTAGTKSVFLMRSTEESKYQVYKLDASFPNGESRDIQMAPGDILFVPRKGIVKADDFMEQYVRQLLPGTPTVGANIFYSPNNSGLSTVAVSK